MIHCLSPNNTLGLLAAEGQDFLDTACRIVSQFYYQRPTSQTTGVCIEITHQDCRLIGRYLAKSDDPSILAVGSS